MIFVAKFNGNVNVDNPIPGLKMMAIMVVTLPTDFRPWPGFPSVPGDLWGTVYSQTFDVSEGGGSFSLNEVVDDIDLSQGGSFQINRFLAGPCDGLPESPPENAKCTLESNSIQGAVTVSTYAYYQVNDIDNSGGQADLDKGKSVSLHFRAYTFTLRWPDGAGGTLNLPNRLVGLPLRVGGDAYLYFLVPAGQATPAHRFPDPPNTPISYSAIAPDSSAPEGVVPYVSNADYDRYAFGRPFSVPLGFTNANGEITLYELSSETVDGVTTLHAPESVLIAVHANHRLFCRFSLDAEGSATWDWQAGVFSSAVPAPTVVGAAGQNVNYTYGPQVQVYVSQKGSTLGIGGVRVTAPNGDILTTVLDGGTLTAAVNFYPGSGGPFPYATRYQRPTGTITQDPPNLSAFGPFPGVAYGVPGYGEAVYSVGVWDVGTVQMWVPANETLSALGFPSNGTARFWDLGGSAAGRSYYSDIAYTLAGGSLELYLPSAFDFVGPGQQVFAYDQTKATDGSVANGTKARFHADYIDGSGKRYSADWWADINEDGPTTVFIPIDLTIPMTGGAALDVAQDRTDQREEFVPAGDAYITRFTGSGPNGQVIQEESNDLDSTFTESVCFTVAAGDQNVSGSRLILGTGRHLLVRDTGGTLSYRTSDDAGRTWSAADTALWPGLAPRIVQATPGRVLLFYLAGAAAPYDLRWRSSSDLAQTWSVESTALTGVAMSPDAPGVAYNGVEWIMALSVAAGVQVWFQGNLEAVDPSAPSVTVAGAVTPWVTCDPVGESTLFYLTGAAPNLTLSCRRIIDPTAGGNPTLGPAVTVQTGLPIASYAAWESAQGLKVVYQQDMNTIAYRHSLDGTTWSDGPS